jgi:hypothetical protein
MCAAEDKNDWIEWERQDESRLGGLSESLK